MKKRTILCLLKGIKIISKLFLGPLFHNIGAEKYCRKTVLKHVNGFHFRECQTAIIFFNFFFPVFCPTKEKLQHNPKRKPGLDHQPPNSANHQ